MTANTANIYQIKITLQNIEPPIWRRIQVPESIPLDELHSILQIVMGWDDYHMHAFRAGKVTYGEPTPYDPGDIEDEYNVPLGSIAHKGDTIIYEYDFGDGWEHELKIEKTLPPELNVNYPHCMEGERACPPEDCGGPWGYNNMLEAINNPQHEEHEEFLEWLHGGYDPEYFNVDEVNEAIVSGGGMLEIPVFDAETLSTLTPDDLIDLMIDHEDRVPRNVIDECARRGDAMLDALTHLAQPDREEEDDDAGYWWLRLHAIMILGLIPGENAGLLLFDYIRNISGEEDEDLREWLGGYWPALMRNKSNAVISQLRDYCEDKHIDWYMRANILEAVIAMAQGQGNAELDQALDWAAHIAADEKVDWDMRLATASTLLDFPRERHKTLLQELAARQSGLGVWFSKKDVADAFAQRKDTPEWERFSDPWKFYNADEIEQRQHRWQKEDAERTYHEDYDDDDSEDDDFIDRPGVSSYHYDFGTYRREAPKTGRNDPCPCGSGKKYKKCCLNKDL
jgi:hypothetical protein